MKGLTGAGARFFALDSRSFDGDQLAWLGKELGDSNSRWKIAYFHHPLYTSGRYQAGADRYALRSRRSWSTEMSTSCFRSRHFYQRIVPQRGIAYFISGGAGSLRRGDIRPSPLNARGFDTDFHFLMMEVSGDELWFQAISRTGATIDAGVITRHAP